MSEPQKQHYVQRAYLNRWSDKSGNIFICDLSNGKIHSGPAKSAAWERYYYCLEDADHPEFKFEIEEFLGNDIESPASPLIDKLDAEKELSSAEKNHLALYIAFQKTRVPFFEKFSNELAEKFDKDKLLKVLKDKALFERFMIDNAEKYKNLIKVPSREEMIRTIEEDRVQMKYPRAHSLKNMLKLSVPLSDLYAQWQWILLEGQGAEFITSDNPVVTISLARKEGGSFGETTFPLSPAHCLLIEQETKGKFAVTQDDLNGVREINRRTLLHATRFLFGNNQQTLEECYQEYVRLQPVRAAMTTKNLNDGIPVSSGEKLFMRRIVVF